MFSPHTRTILPLNTDIYQSSSCDRCLVFLSQAPQLCTCKQAKDLFSKLTDSSPKLNPLYTHNSQNIKPSLQIIHAAHTHVHTCSHTHAHTHTWHIHMCTHTRTHTHTHTHTHKKQSKAKQSVSLPLSGHAIWHSQNARALSGPMSQCNATSWSRARNSQVD